METIKLFICLCQQKDYHEQKQNYSRFTKAGFQCNDSPPWCDKSWNVHWRGSFPLSPIIRQTFSLLPQKLGMLPFDTFERVFYSPSVFLFGTENRENWMNSFKPTTHAFVNLLTYRLFCGRIEREWIMERWSIERKRESTNIHLRLQLNHNWMMIRYVIQFLKL